MAKEIKAIETKYNGYKFRSRLEARWAIFFDESKIKYQYELEGFTLSNGLNYLPDFFLPELKIFVEVKPLFPETETELRKIFCFGCTDNKPLLLICGTPQEEKMYFISGINTSYDDWVSLFQEPEIECDTLPKYIETISKEWTQVEFAYDAINKAHVVISQKETVPHNVKYTTSYATAKQARFEFGEKG